MDTKQWYREEGSGECSGPFLSVTVAGTLALLRRSLHPLLCSTGPADTACAKRRPTPYTSDAPGHGRNPSPAVPLLVLACQPFQRQCSSLMIMAAQWGFIWRGSHPFAILGSWPRGCRTRSEIALVSRRNRTLKSPPALAVEEGPPMWTQREPSEIQSRSPEIPERPDG
jgi:hypothetical protein